jgi:hypothetical protein
MLIYDTGVWAMVGVWYGEGPKHVYVLYEASGFLHIALSDEH